MRRSRCVLLMLIVALALPALLPASVRADNGRRVRVSEYAEGNAYCPRHSVEVGRVIIPAGQCYTLAVFRNDRGAYLAFLDPSVRLHRHEAERLFSLEGRRAWNQIRFLVPIPRDSRIALIPMNTIQLVRLREEDDDEEDLPRTGHSALVVLLPAPAVPNVSATFIITF